MRKAIGGQRGKHHFGDISFKEESTRNGISPFGIGNTSSFRVHVSASLVRLPESIKRFHHHHPQKIDPWHPRSLLLKDLHSLYKTNQNAPENMQRAPKGNEKVFQASISSCKVAVRLREGKFPPDFVKKNTCSGHLDLFTACPKPSITPQKISMI